MLAKIDAELTDLFASYDSTPGNAVLDEIHGSLNRRRYISNLVREVDKELNVHISN